MFCAKKVQRNVGLVADDPAVVSGWTGRNIEEHAGAKLVNFAVVHGRGSAAGDDESDMLDIAARCADARPT